MDNIKSPGLIFCRMHYERENCLGTRRPETGSTWRSSLVKVSNENNWMYWCKDGNGD